MVELFLILDAHFAERLFRMILETVDLLIRRSQTATSLFGGGCYDNWKRDIRKY